jgi:hypothetical protein
MVGERVSGRNSGEVSAPDPLEAHFICRCHAVHLGLGENPRSHQFLRIPRSRATSKAPLRPSTPRVRYKRVRSRCRDRVER